MYHFCTRQSNLIMNENINVVRPMYVMCKNYNIEVLTKIAVFIRYSILLATTVHRIVQDFPTFFAWCPPCIIKNISCPRIFFFIASIKTQIIFTIFISHDLLFINRMFAPAFYEPVSQYQVLFLTKLSSNHYRLQDDFAA